MWLLRVAAVESGEEGCAGECMLLGCGVCMFRIGFVRRRDISWLLDAYQPGCPRGIVESHSLCHRVGKLLFADRHLQRKHPATRAAVCDTDSVCPTDCLCALDGDS